MMAVQRAVQRAVVWAVQKVAEMAESSAATRGHGKAGWTAA